jgi:ribosome-associated protein
MLTGPQVAAIFKELKYHTSRSGGKGGQNVNKVETKVAIEFDVEHSEALSPSQKLVILSKLPHDGDKVIRLVSAVHRSQLENKEEARSKLLILINKMLKPVKKRLATKPSKSSKRKKSESKKKLSEKKQLRRKMF